MLTVSACGTAGSCDINIDVQMLLTRDRGAAPGSQRPQWARQLRRLHSRRQGHRDGRRRGRCRPPCLEPQIRGVREQHPGAYLPHRRRDSCFACACFGIAHSSFREHMGLIRAAAITCLAAHADGATVITGSEDKTARLSNVQTSRVLGAFTGALLLAYSLAPFASCRCVMSRICESPIMKV